MPVIDPAILRDVVVSSLPYALPLIVTCLTCAIVALVFGRGGRVWLVVIAMVLFMLPRVVNPVWQAYLITRDARFGPVYETGRDHTLSTFVWVTLGLMEVGAIALLTVAALRTGRTHVADDSRFMRDGGHDGATGAELPPLPDQRVISKGLYLGLLIGSVLATWTLVAFAIALTATAGRNESQAIAGAGVACAAFAPVVVTMVTVCVLLYRMWSAIQGYDVARTTPGKAVGFLFIPVFNFYWVFQVYRGWAVDYNRIMSARGLPDRVSEGLATTVCVLMLFSLIPYLGLLVSVVNLVLVLVFFSSAISGVNRLNGVHR